LFVKPRQSLERQNLSCCVFFKPLILVFKILIALYFLILFSLLYFHENAFLELSHYLEGLPPTVRLTFVDISSNRSFFQENKIPQDINVLFLFHASLCKFIFQCCILQVSILHSSIFPYKLLTFLIKS
jgi:hypothetical protein